MNYQLLPISLATTKPHLPCSPIPASINVGTTRYGAFPVGSGLALQPKCRMKFDIVIEETINAEDIDDVTYSPS